MAAGRPRIVDPQELYFFAQLFYWDFRSIDEGHVRWRFDQQEFDASVAELNKKELSEKDRERLRREAEEEVLAGRLEASKKQEWLKNREADQVWMVRERERNIAAAEGEKELRVPGDPDVLEALLEARTAKRVREICEDAFARIPVEIRHAVYREVEVANWPISSGSMFPRYLSQHAEQFIAAKSDSRFPVSGRATSKLKQFWFLSRALAGAVLGVQTRTAINLVGSKRPEQVFEESRAGKPERMRTNRKRLS